MLLTAELLSHNFRGCKEAAVSNTDMGHASHSLCSAVKSLDYFEEKVLFRLAPPFSPDSC